MNEFISGHFDQFRKETLLYARTDPSLSTKHNSGKIKIFLSHKHEDLNDLNGIIGFLEKNYPTICYIDSQDPDMPQVTSGETAAKIKQRIKACDKFMLLATTKAIESKWCNWELGFGDADKFQTDGIAIFPLKLQAEKVNDFRGNEYMDIYPSVVYRTGDEKYTDETPATRGYYIREKIPSEKRYTLTPLDKWLKK